MKNSKALLTFDIVTLMPEMFSSISDYGITGRAFKEEIVELNLWNPRDFSMDFHKTVDDPPIIGDDPIKSGDDLGQKQQWVLPPRGQQPVRALVILEMISKNRR